MQCNARSHPLDGILQNRYLAELALPGVGAVARMGTGKENADPVPSQITVSTIKAFSYPYNHPIEAAMRASPPEFARGRRSHPQYQAE